MMLDRSTEIIAHMIGIFHTTLEDMRLREIYETFKALKAKDQDHEEIESVSVSFKAGYRLEGFAPDVDYTPQHDAAGPSALPAPDFFLTGHGPYGIGPVSGRAAAEQQIAAAIPLGGGSGFLPVLEPPGSVVVITFQSSFLYDNDLLLLGDGSTVFTDPGELLLDLYQYQTIAAALAAPVSSDVLLPGGSAREDAVALHDRIGSVQAPPLLTGVIASVMHGEDAGGVHVNGAEAGELPSLEDLMPAYHKAKAGGTDEGGETAGEDDAYEWPDPFEGLGGTGDDAEDYHIEAGHTVVTGGNTLVNEVSIHSAWLDAPVISVMGDVVDLEVIAQINVLVDHNSGFGAPAHSAAYNGAAMSFARAASGQAGGEAAAAGPGGALPSNWVVTRIDGDLISFNQIIQYSFQTDYDRAEVSFSSTNTYIGLGDNTIANLTSLSELGFGYDMIFIGGNMISVNWISQTNVLIDNDSVTLSGSTSASLGAGDNLLFNSAGITGSGLDYYSGMSAAMAGASAQLSGGDHGFNGAAANSPVFEGTELLRVLYIEGDLTTVNWIEQTNILGDSDQVHLALENLEGADGADITVTAGSNAVINLASIHEYGTDSDVSVGGEVYTDALLYQAELIDTDADPLGVELSGLASEAVVFLADGMAGAEEPQTGEVIVATAPEDTTSPDVMQTMLA